MAQQQQRAGIPPIPPNRIPSARPSSSRPHPLASQKFPASQFNQANNNDPNKHDNADLLNLRVKERNFATEERPKSRLTSLFSSTTSTSTQQTFESQQKHSESKLDIKETLTRPLSSLFRRSQSSSSSPKNNKTPYTQKDTIQHNNASLSTSSTVTKAPILDVNASIESNEIRQFRFQNDLSEQAAFAPHININQISSRLYTTDPILKHFNSINLDNLEKSYLTRFLCAEEESIDEQIPWTWDYLYTSIIDELRQEWITEGNATENPTSTHLASTTTKTAQQNSMV